MEEENLQFDYRAGLSKVIAPVLLIAGEDDGAHPLNSMQETAASIRADLAYVHIVKDAGAPVYNDQPSKVLQILNSFLEKNANSNAKCNSINNSDGQCPSN